MKKDEFSKIELLIGNSSRKFSGGTSIMLQLLNYQARIKPLVVIGKHFVPDNIQSISFLNFLKCSESLFIFSLKSFNPPTLTAERIQSAISPCSSCMS